MAIINSINLSSLDGGNGFRLDGAAAYDQSGGSVSNAGDVNGDGFDDVIINAVGVDQDAYSSGASYVVFGKASGFNATLDLSALDGSNGFRLDGETTGGSLYAIRTDTVSDAGDINGDGFDDVLVGAHLRDGSSAIYPHDAGYSYVVFGKSSGFSPTLDLSSLDGNNGFHLTQLLSNGSNVSSAGDINGDGFDDFIAGAPTPFTVGGLDASYVVFGKAGGFSAHMNVSSLDGSNGFRLIGGATYDLLGSSVSGAGDVNGDGFDDVLVGAPGADPNGSSSGSIYVVFGKVGGFGATMDLSSLDGNNGFRLDGASAGDDSGSSVSNAGDVNGDGFDDLIIGAAGSSYVVFGKISGFSATMNLSDLDGSNGFRLYGASGSVGNAGDVNGDGFDDLIVGASGADPNGDRSGSSYVVFGRAAGFSAVIDLSSLDSNTGVRLDGVAAFDYSGASVSSGGDVNGDGFDDLLVGAPSADPNGDRSGSSYVIFGSSNFSGIVTLLGTAEDDNLTGTAAAERFEAGDGNDTIIGGGGADVIHGENGDDIIKIPDLNFQLVDGEIGTDTLELTGESIHLNLADFRDTIRNIESIDLSGSGDNTLTITAASNLFDLSDTTDTLVVKGNAGDRVVGLSRGWTDGGIQGNFHTYTKHGAVLQIDLAVSTDPLTASVINLSNLDGNDGFRLNGAAEEDSLGRSVSNAGDVNGDGFDDVIIGAPGADPNGEESGSSYVVFGKATGFDAAINLSSLDGNNGFRLDGVAAYTALGGSVSSAGDINSDSFDDLIIGAPAVGGLALSSSYVVFGKAAGFSAAMNLSSLNGNNGFRLDGAADIGDSVSNAGDINGDGFDDVIVGAPDATPSGEFQAGSSYVVFGKASGFSATFDLSSLDGSNGFRLDGTAEEDSSGRSVSNAGDVNGDGFDDLIIGAAGADPNGKFLAGSSYVVFGKSSGFDPTLNLFSLDGSNGFRLDGTAKEDFSGGSVSNAGDVNGDGFDDLIVGANRVDSNGKQSVGASYVVFGKASGFSATLDLSNLDGNNGFRVVGVYDQEYSGDSVGGAGDFNGDGFDDLIIESGGSDPSFSIYSYIVFGRASGFSATLSLSSLDGNTGILLNAGLEGGGPVSSAGDVNGDGFDDVIVGNPYSSSNGYSSGASYVIFGSRDFGGGGGNVIQGTPGDDVLRGTSAADIFEADDGNDLLVGRGGEDVFKAGAGNDKITVTDLDFVSVAGGAGNDVLHLAGNGLNLDLADFGGDISGIETFCLFGQGDNTLTLTAADLLNLSDTSNTLKVNGNAAGHIIVEDGGWVDGGSRGSGYYHVYTNDEAVLLVGQNITVDFT